MYAGCVAQPGSFGPAEVAVITAAAGARLPASRVWMVFGDDVPPSCAVTRMASALATVFVRELALPCPARSDSIGDVALAAALAGIKPRGGAG